MSTVTTKRLDLLFTSKTLIIFSLVISIFGLYYFVIKSKTSSSTINFLVSSLPSLSSRELNSNPCQLSMKESDDWFCELDSDWKRRKMLHHIQNKRNRISDMRPLFFQNNWEPTIQCEFERRVGNIGDGGKWVCDIHRFGPMNTTNLLVYSLGSNGDFSFERAIKELFRNAEIHTFDMGLFKCPENVCTFHQVRLGSGKNDSSKSLQMVMNELGHQNRQIHILKVDIEGSEFNFFEELFQSSNNNQSDLPYIRQILFEIHLGADRSEAPCRRAHKLFELFRSYNYAIFHKEANLYDAQNVFEYAMLRLNPSFFISPL
ncbi:unnamed protein product [Rotaria sp. Silwood1]|nr:unnamed protein product [Rotaria sp. Silwood1]CAF1165883.1 unnamed protein product [Rotaria sp. Silwood1]CAF3495134.1 unnamed protein product [Rotaria sp. Silwood1]